VPLDPLNIPRLEYREGNDNFKMKQVLSNVTIYGIRDSKLLDVRYAASTDCLPGCETCDLKTSPVCSSEKYARSLLYLTIPAA
jgi:hypothetical protein